MATETSETVHSRILLLYLGEHWQEGKRFCRFVRLTEEMIAGKEPLVLANDAIFDRKAIKLSKLAARPGLVFEFQGSIDPLNHNHLTIVPSSGRYVRQWPDEASVVAWDAEDRANRMAINLLAAGKTAGEENPTLEALRPVREAYKRLRGLQRSLLLAKVVEYITGGG